MVAGCVLFCSVCGLLLFVWCPLFVVRGLLFVECWLLLCFVVCCLPCVVCCCVFVCVVFCMSYSLFVVWRVLCLFFLFCRDGLRLLFDVCRSLRVASCALCVACWLLFMFVWRLVFWRLVLSVWCLIVACCMLLSVGRRVWFVVVCCMVCYVSCVLCMVSCVLWLVACGLWFVCCVLLC